MSQRMMHEQFVDRWMTGGSSVLAFERGLAAVWKRCDLVLGVVTLRAVADRVLAVTHEAYPWMHAVALEGDGFDLSRLRAGSSVPAAETLAAGLKFLLLELLTILGKLTGEMITPALHADLAAVERPKSSDGNKESGP